MYDTIVDILDRNSLEQRRLVPFNDEAALIFERELVQIKAYKRRKIQGMMILSYDITNDIHLRDRVKKLTYECGFNYKIETTTFRNKPVTAISAYIPFGGREIYERRKKI